MIDEIVRDEHGQTNSNKQTQTNKLKQTNSNKQTQTSKLKQTNSNKQTQTNKLKQTNFQHALMLSLSSIHTEQHTLTTKRLRGNDDAGNAYGHSWFLSISTHACRCCGALQQLHCILAISTQVLFFCFFAFFT
jgi:hypothetical protein